MNGMSAQPERAFPKKCPECGRPRRFISFIRLSHSELMPFAWIPLVDKRLGKTGPLFAECQACHEGWVWAQDKGQWIKVEQIRRASKGRLKTGKVEGAKDRIGKVY
jgi:hypothetical protein